MDAPSQEAGRDDISCEPKEGVGLGQGDDDSKSSAEHIPPAVCMEQAFDVRGQDSGEDSGSFW